MASSRACTRSSIGATISSRRAVVAERILRQRRAQARQHAVVIDDQAEILAGIDPVRPRDGLHQRVRLHRLVDVQRGEALHVEAGQPHRADDRHAEWMIRVLERGLDIDALAVAASRSPASSGRDAG